MINAKNDSLLKDDIAESLIILLQKNTLDNISIKEIVSKAGVNRSTYYRHYESKLDVVRHYYASLIDNYIATVPENVTVKQYLVGMFSTFSEHKKELIILDQHSLSYLLLDEMNSRIPQAHGNYRDAIISLYSNYHIGGVFNSFKYWLQEGMKTSPEDLADQCISFLPDEFSPKLIHTSSK